MNGGNIIVTHDHWSYIGNKGYFELFGAKLKHQQVTIVKKAKILNNSHPFLHHFIKFM